MTDDLGTAEGTKRPSGRPESRASAIQAYREEKVRRFQEWIKEDPGLLAQTFVDPLRTLIRHGMIEPGDREVTLQITEGSLLDVARLGEAIAAHGLADILRKSGERQTERRIGRPGADRLCGSIYVDGVYRGDGCIEFAWWWVYVSVTV